MTGAPNKSPRVYTKIHIRPWADSSQTCFVYSLHLLYCRISVTCSCWLQKFTTTCSIFFAPILICKHACTQDHCQAVRTTSQVSGWAFNMYKLFWAWSCDSGKQKAFGYRRFLRQLWQGEFCAFMDGPELVVSCLLLPIKICFHHIMCCNKLYHVSAQEMFYVRPANGPISLQHVFKQPKCKRWLNMGEKYLMFYVSSRVKFYLSRHCRFISTIQGGQEYTRKNLLVYGM
jgi:hypothetical protein